MPKLIALVTVTALVDGQRHEFQPGEELPDGALSRHDVSELKRLGSIEDRDDVAAAEKGQARAEAKANADFERERQAVAAAQASTAEPKAAGKKK